MNKTTIIGITVLVSVGISVSSAYAITITLAGDADVTGNLAVTGAITGSTIDGINAAIASGSAVCPSENIEHWDKIAFVPDVVITNLDQNVNPLILEIGFAYDIKVLDDPNSVAFLEGKVVDKLNTLGYRTAGAPVQKIDLFVFEVEYAIICVGP